MVACKIQKIEICDKKVKNMTKFVFCKYCLDLDHCILISIWEKKGGFELLCKCFLFFIKGKFDQKNAENGGKDCFYAKSNWIVLNVKKCTFSKKNQQYILSAEIPTSEWKRFTLYWNEKKINKKRYKLQIRLPNYDKWKIALAALIKQSQCRNYGNLLSRCFGKNFVKVTL